MSATKENLKHSAACRKGVHLYMDTISITGACISCVHVCVHGQCIKHRWWLRRPDAARRHVHDPPREEIQRLFTPEEKLYGKTNVNAMEYITNMKTGYRHRRK